MKLGYFKTVYKYMLVKQGVKMELAIASWFPNLIVMILLESNVLDLTSVTLKMHVGKVQQPLYITKPLCL